MSTSTFYEVADDRPAGAGLVAAAPIAAGTAVADFADRPVHTVPSVYTIQVGVAEHVDSPTVRYLNHSCAANVFVDTVARIVITMRAIGQGEELTFFYPSTEWAMVRPFACLCAAPDCIGMVQGAYFLPSDVLARYPLSPHIRKLDADRGGPSRDRPPVPGSGS
ncbi:SET domain-containing protein [Actinomadura rugatobispora]|uniref:SET domain-containing protein n=1 Tax=Actinomadura rugatobispora TaxID=1994 RepID=A0ABW1A6W7_9ACTN|nr:hypothetical protein GCM10010200_022360 [Actinomadura rugatobispora]